MLVGVPLGHLLQARRQERRIRPHHRPGLRLLLPLFDRNSSGPPEQGSCGCRRLAGKCALRNLRRDSAAADVHRRRRTRRDHIDRRLVQSRSANPTQTKHRKLRASTAPPNLATPADASRSSLTSTFSRNFSATFAMVLVSFVMLMLVFTCFELLGDIIRNRTSFVTVAAYLANLTPSMIYTITPLAVLIAVLVVFGLMSKSSELTAMKASGISLYRIVLPVFIIASMLAVSALRLRPGLSAHRPTAVRKPSATSSRASRRRPSSIPDRSGSSACRSPASPAASSTTSSSIRHRTPSATSPSSSSIPRPSPFRAASSPPTSTGSRSCTNGSSSTDGSAPSTAPRSAATAPST